MTSIIPPMQPRQYVEKIDVRYIEHIIANCASCGEQLVGAYQLSIGDTIHYLCMDALVEIADQIQETIGSVPWQGEGE